MQRTEHPGHPSVLSRSSPGHAGQGGLWLTVLGTAAPYPRPGRPCSGYLLRTPTAAVWVEAGSGTMAELQRHLPLAALSAIWFSHLHPDHCSDLLGAYQWLATAPAPLPRLPVFGPPGWTRRVEAFLPNGYPGLLSRFFDPHELADGQTTTVGDLVLTSRSVTHSVPTFGLRAEHDGRVLAYAGDSGPCDALVELAAGAHVFVCEAGYAQRTPQHTPYHSTPEEAGRTAALAGADRLLLTHLDLGLTAEQARQRAARVHARAVAVAEPGTHLRV